MGNLQEINWLQINSDYVPSGSVIDIGSINKALHAGYFENIFIDGISVDVFIKQQGINELNIYSSSLKNAIELNNQNVTIKGNLSVLGSTTTINSNTVSLGDNIIELNGNNQTNAGLIVKDPTLNNLISGSLLWDSANDFWKAGQLNNEKRIVTQTGSLNNNIIPKTLSDGILTNSRISDDNNIIKIDVSQTGSLLVTGSMKIIGDLIVEGKTILVQKIDPNIESLIVSGAMKIVMNEINTHITSASLNIQNLGTLSDIKNNSIIDCGDSFY